MLVALTLAACGRETIVGLQDSGFDDEPDASLSDVRQQDAGHSSGSDAGGDDSGTPDAGAPDAGAPDAGLPDSGTIDAGLPPIDGIVFVHGINGSAADWATMVARFKADGFPADRLVAHTFADPKWGCNATNAKQVDTWVHDLQSLGAKRVAVVAHSMGGLSSRYFVKNLGGTSKVAVFSTLGTMHHGLTTPCLNPLPVCVWQELCATGAYITELNLAPATPGPTKWVSIFSDGDQTVPTSSSTLIGAENIMVPGLSHDGPTGLQESEVVYQRVRDVLH